MRAVLCKAWGGPEDLVVEQVPMPRPGRGEIRVAVEVAGVNFADTLMIAGQYQEKPAFPFSPGLECAGVVDALGDGVDGVAIGDRVMAVAGHGAFAEAAVMPADRVFPIPDVMPFDIAAAFPVAYGTSHLALCHRAGLSAGEVLLVHGAAGGVGLTAVEIGKTVGATVIATAGGADKLAVAAEYGADHLIDYRNEDVRDVVLRLTGGSGADVVYDPVGGEVFDASLRWKAAYSSSASPAARFPRRRSIGSWSRTSASSASTGVPIWRAIQRPFAPPSPICSAGTPPAGSGRICHTDCRSSRRPGPSTCFVRAGRPARSY